MLAYLHDKHVFEAEFDRVMDEFGWHTCSSYCMTKVKHSLTFLSGAYMSRYMLVCVTVCHTVKRQLNFTCCAGKMFHSSSMECANAKRHEKIILQFINCYREHPTIVCTTENTLWFIFFFNAKARPNGN